MISRTEIFLSRLNKIVEENLSDFLFGVNQLAEQLNLSRSSLFRKVRQATNCTPLQYIKNKRLDKASKLIKNDVDQVKQIALSVGFTDQSYFAKCFYKRFDVLPSKYREQTTN